MNSRQLQYAIELSNIRNFSQVAEKLNISQPALSKQILALESELGLKLFDRSCTPLTVTPAGQHFLREAKELLYKEDQLLRSMEQFRSGEAGQLTIGVTPFRSSYMMPRIVKAFRDVYPNIRVTLQEYGTDVLRKEAAEGKYDFAIVNLPVDETVFDITPLEADRLVLLVPPQWKHKIAAAPGETEIDFSACKELPFVVVHPNQEMRRLFENMCAVHDFHPQIAAEVVGLTTAWAMACAGVAATILPLQFVSQKSMDSNMTILGIQNAPCARQPAIITRKGQYIPSHARFAMDLLTNH